MNTPVSRLLGEGEVVFCNVRAPYKEGDEPNEDQLAVIDINEDNWLLVVADGVGGLPRGELASNTVIDHLSRGFAGEADVETISASAVTALESAHDELLAEANGAASTVAAVHIVAGGDGPDRYRSLHAGDSMVLVCSQRGQVKFETISHSPVGYALESGLLSEEDAFSHAERHVVSNLIGGDSLHITIGGTSALAARDTIIVCSDGVTDNLRQAEIVEAIRAGKLEQCARNLADLVEARMLGEGKPDDMSFVLYRRRARRRSGGNAGD